MDVQSPTGYHKASGAGETNLRQVACIVEMQDCGLSDPFVRKRFEGWCFPDRVSSPLCTHSVGELMRLRCRSLIEVPSGRGHGLGQVAADHLGGQTAKLCGSGDETGSDGVQEGRRGWVAQSGMNERHILGIRFRFEDVKRRLQNPRRIGRRSCRVVGIGRKSCRIMAIKAIEGHYP